MHTPEQAKELWCPMVRIARNEVIEHRTGYQEDSRDERVIVAGCNTDALGSTRVPASCRCIADRCAMWRWVPDGQYHAGDAQWKETREKGFCGIAGRPEVTA